MKKVLSLFICLLALGTIYGEDKDLLGNYYKDSSLENIEAILEDANQSLDNNQANLNLLLVHYNEMNKAINRLEINADSLQPAQRFQLANTYLSLGKTEQAIAHYGVLNENFADWSCPWRHKGEAYYNLGDWENAETALNMAIETRIEHYDAYVWLAKVQLKLNKNKEALKTFETAMYYKGKDVEEPEEEVSSEEEKFLKLEILQANKMKKEKKKLEKTLKEEYPNSKYWEN